MTDFDSETAVAAVGDGRFSTHVSAGWNIGTNPNGGYLLSSVLRALTAESGLAAPLSATTQFLRPGISDTDGEIRTSLIRSGRRLSRYQASLHQQDKDIVTVVAALGAIGASPAEEYDLSIAPPEIPDPGQCVPRSGLEQGVALPINRRLDVRLPASQAMAGTSNTAELSGWIRFRDGREPDVLCLPLFCDAFPPSVFAIFGYVGWVPTVELTVHVRRQPAPGWVRGHFVCRDIADGYMIEDGTLWDSDGKVVARSRQLGIVQPPRSDADTGSR